MENKTDLPKRKATRLKGFDYSSVGAYFVTVCTEKRKKILSDISVGDGVLDVPNNTLTKYGEIADRYLNEMNDFYDFITIDKYVIMPNHIHLILSITAQDSYSNSGTSGTPAPTSLPDMTNKYNTIIPNFISTFKRFCNKKYGENIWQRSFHDHIIRNENDYRKIWEYIDTNVVKWESDCFYTD